MKNLKRKGFTIIELVIVIAVIAVLAAVLIPTFSSLVKKANMSADMQVVRNMNTALAADEIVDGKPATVVEAKEVLVQNGISNFKTHDSNNAYYWVGIDNRVILWDIINNKVTYPEEYVKKYKDVNSPSVDWDNLDGDYSSNIITPEDGEDLEDALITEINNADVSKDNHFILPKNSILEFHEEMRTAFYNATIKDGTTKNVSIDLNGSILNVEDVLPNQSAFMIAQSGTLEFVNGKINIDADLDNAHGFEVKENASLILRNIEVTGTAHTMIFPQSTASEVIIDNSNINIAGIWALMTNGQTSNNIRVIIENSYIKNSEDLCVMVNCKSNVYINNSTLSGWAHALVMRAGNVQVKNSKLETFGEDPYIYKYDEFKHFPNKPKINGVEVEKATYLWGGANAVPGATLVLGDYDSINTTYPGDVKCSLENVIFESKNKVKIPYVLLAAKAGKNVIFDYDKCNIDEIQMFNYMIPEYYGSITVNNEVKTLNN